MKFDESFLKSARCSGIARFVYFPTPEENKMMAINILITSFEMEVRVRWSKGRKIKFFMGRKNGFLVVLLFWEEKLTSSKRGMLDSLRLLLDPLLESDIEY